MHEADIDIEAWVAWATHEGVITKSELLRQYAKIKNIPLINIPLVTPTTASYNTGGTDNG
jgi:hypothetical protein